MFQPLTAYRIAVSYWGMEEITTISELYDAFGGAAAVAQFLGVSRSASGNWASENILPAHHFPKIQEALAEKGRKVSLSLFRMTRKKPKAHPPFRPDERQPDCALSPSEALAAPSRTSPDALIGGAS